MNFSFRVVKASFIKELRVWRRNPQKLVLLANATSSGEFNTCTQCHRLHPETYHSAEHGHSWSSPSYVNGVGNFSPHEIIYDTHFDINTTDQIEGYILDPANPDVCTECHDVHSLDLEINEQWARSAHGGHILDIKDRAFLNASVIGGSEIGNVAAVSDVLNGVDGYGAHQGQ